jgi:hypothetical protein
MHGELQLSTRRKHMASRYPSGQTKGKHDKRDDRVVLWRRIKDHAVRMGADPDMGSVIGRLSLAGILTDSESAAAIWAAETIGRYERLQGYLAGRLLAQLTSVPMRDRQMRGRAPRSTSGASTRQGGPRSDWKRQSCV